MDIPSDPELLKSKRVELETLSDLITKKNEIENEIAAIIHRPALIGHTGEFIASIIFDIQLMESASHRAIDGHFRSGLLAGKSVNIKWYGKQERLLDITPNVIPDFYLVMTGPKSSLVSSRDRVRPWCIEFVYIFQTIDLCNQLSARNSKMGIATSIVKNLWDQAEIFPNSHSSILLLSSVQKELLGFFQQA